MTLTFTLPISRTFLTKIPTVSLNLTSRTQKSLKNVWTRKMFSLLKNDLLLLAKHVFQFSVVCTNPRTRTHKSDWSVPPGCLCGAVTHAASWSTRSPRLTWIKLRGCPLLICRATETHPPPERAGQKHTGCEREGRKQGLGKKKAGWRQGAGEEEEVNKKRGIERLPVREVRGFQS